MRRLLIKAGYYVFLAILAVIEGTLLPILVLLGAINIWNEKYIIGGIFLLVAAVWNHWSQLIFDHRKKLRQNNPDRKD